MESIEFFGVRCVGVFEHRKFFLIGVVAGIDAYFLDMLDCFHCGLRKEVDIGNEWLRESSAAKLLVNGL